MLLGLSGGTPPQRVVVAGHSLGAALRLVGWFLQFCLTPAANVCGCKPGTEKHVVCAWCTLLALLWKLADLSQLQLLAQSALKEWLPVRCSELTAVWASTVWPEASILVANTGAPQVVRCGGWKGLHAGLESGLAALRLRPDVAMPVADHFSIAGRWRLGAGVHCHRGPGVPLR